MENKSTHGSSLLGDRRGLGDSRNSGVDGLDLLDGGNNGSSSFRCRHYGRKLEKDAIKVR